MKKKISKEINVKNKDSVLQKTKKKIGISFLTIMLAVFFVQLLWGVVINSFKIYSLNTKIVKLEKINKIAERKNKELHRELEKYTSNAGVEALARNRLKFSKENETLIIIKTPQENAEF